MIKMIPAWRYMARSGATEMWEDPLSATCHLKLHLPHLRHICSLLGQSNSQKLNGDYRPQVIHEEVECRRAVVDFWE
jgi:hypothetical protein